MDSSPRVSQLLGRLRNGDDAALEALLPLVYTELRATAARLFAAERADHTLQPTAVVHEAFLKLAGGDVPAQDRGHFLALAARAMRQVLVEHARARGRQKRGGDRVRVTLSDVHATSGDADSLDLLALDDALTQLADHDERKARVVELSYFGGLSARESADLLGVTPRTVERDWHYAKAWLARELGT